MPTPSTAKWPKPKSEDEFEDIVVDFVRLRWRDPIDAVAKRLAEVRSCEVVTGKPIAGTSDLDLGVGRQAVR